MIFFFLAENPGGFTMVISVDCLWNAGYLELVDQECLPSETTSHRL